MPHPQAVYATPPHYTSKGVSEESRKSGESMRNDSGAAYRFALAYVITGDAKYAKVTQRILDAWAHTLKELKTVQSVDNVNFNFPYRFMPHLGCAMRINGTIAISMPSCEKV